MDKLIKILTHEVATVVLLGAVSVITAWAGVQSSLHDGDADDALSSYMEGLSESNNMWLTSELKYRTDIPVWVDKQTKRSQGADINVGYSAGSFEFFELGMPCLAKTPESQPADCKAYMDALYVPLQQVADAANQSRQEYEVESRHSDRLQMLTALLAISLFMLGITSVIRREKLRFSIVLGAAAIGVFSIAILLRIPVVAVF